jgi:hypothetical protein
LDRPKYDHVVVTADTEVPALPAKDDLIKQPSKEAFNA